VVEIGIGHRSSQFAPDGGIIEVGLFKRPEFAKEHSQQGPEWLMPAFAELPERSEEDESIGWTRTDSRVNGECCAHRESNNDDTFVAALQVRE